MNSLKSKSLKSWFNEKIVIIKLVKLQYTIKDDRSSRSEKESLKSFQVGGSKCGVYRKKHINKEWQFFTVYIHTCMYVCTYIHVCNIYTCILIKHECRFDKSIFKIN